VQPSGPSFGDERICSVANPPAVPLPAGTPRDVKKAQMDNNAILIIGASVWLGLGIGLCQPQWRRPTTSTGADQLPHLAVTPNDLRMGLGEPRGSPNFVCLVPGKRLQGRRA